jgi:hypothetical protein
VFLIGRGLHLKISFPSRLKPNQYLCALR